MDGSLVRNWADICVFDTNIESFLDGEVVELVVDVVGVLDILLKTDDGEALEGLRLVDHRVETVGVIQGTGSCRVWIRSRGRVRLCLVVLIATRSLLLEVGGLEDLRLFENLGFNSVRVELDVQSPLLDLLTFSNHLVELLDRVDTIVRLLEKTLAHLCDGLFVFADLLRDTDEHGEFGRQVDVLALLLDFKQGLVHLEDLLIILLLEVGGHGDGGTGLSLLKVTRFRAHVEAHIADLISLVVSVAGHDDGALELVNDSFLELLWAGLLVRVPLALESESLHLLVNQL